MMTLKSWPKSWGRGAILSIGCAFAQPALAQDPAPAPEQKIADIGSLVKPAAEAPGFEAIGKSGSDISYPGTVQKVALGLLNGLDQNGDLNAGVAVQFSPYLLLNSKNLSSEAYLRNQALARLSLTAATAKAADDDKGLVASLGFSWMPIAQDDPYGDRALDSCLEPIMGPETPEGDDEGGTVPGSAAEIAIQKKCVDAFKNKGKLNVQVGAAALFFSETGKTDALKGKGFYATGVLRYTLPQQDLSLVGAASYRSAEKVPDPATKGAFLERDRLSVGGRVVFGGGKTYIFGLEAAYQWADYKARGRDDYVTYVGAVDLKLLDEVWVSFKLGGSSGRRIDGNPAFFGTSLNWGKKPSISS